RLDDFLIIPEVTEQGVSPGVDVVFAVSREAFAQKTKDGTKDALKVADGTFLEIKRTARLKLDTFFIDPYIFPPPKLKLGIWHQNPVKADQPPRELSTTRPAMQAPVVPAKP